MGTRKKSYRKAKKGTVSLQELKDRRRFKYRFQSTVFYLTLPHAGQLHPIVEEQIRRVIEIDIHNGVHFPQKYKDLVASKGVEPVAADESGLLILLGDYLTRTGRSLDKSLYFATYQMVKAWGDTSIHQIPERLEAEKYAARTFNDRKLVLKGMCEWLLRNGKIKLNPMHDVPSRKKNGWKDPKRKRLSNDEVNKILEAIQSNQFVSKSSRYKHSSYYPIFKFLAFTGVRPAEAIGIQVKKIDFKKRVICIDDALARTRAGTSAGNRIRKETKMGDHRELPLKRGSTLHHLLIQQTKGKGSDDLVFTSPTGVACDDRSMNDVLKVVLKGLEIPDRVVYVFRHSFISRCFEQGLNVKAVQSLTGHKDVTVLLQIYAEVTREKVVLPNLK